MTGEQVGVRQCGVTDVGMDGVKILVIKMSSLGDILHALPAVHNLRAKTGATVHWVVQPTYADFVRCFPDVERVIAFPRHGFFRHAGHFLDELRRDVYDWILDMQGLLKSALVARLARGARRVGPSFHREGAWLLYSETAGRRNQHRHAVEENLDFVDHLGVERIPPQFPIQVPPCPLDAPRPRVAFVPFSRWPSKNWPAEHFVHVARCVRVRTGATLFIFGAADDTSCHQMAERLGNDAINLAGSTSLVELASRLRQMDLLVASDSGPVHLAAALGVPTLVVFGPTDPIRTGPYGDRHRVIRAGLSCQPCFRRRCTHDETPACLAAVRPEEVSAAALQMLWHRSSDGVSHVHPSTGFS